MEQLGCSVVGGCLLSSLSLLGAGNWKGLLPCLLCSYPGFNQGLVEEMPVLVDLRIEVFPFRRGKQPTGSL